MDLPIHRRQSTLSIPWVSQPPFIMILNVIKKQVYETERALTTGRENEKEFAKLAEEFFEARGRQGASILSILQRHCRRMTSQFRNDCVWQCRQSGILKAARLLKADLIVMKPP